MRRFVAGLLILVSALSVVLASTSLWLRRNVINTEVFVTNVETMVDLPEVEARITERVTTTVMTNPDVQDAIDEAVAALPERLQQFRPTVESGISSLIAVGVQRVLRNDPFRPLTAAAVTSAHDQLVNGESVEFTLGMAKDLVPASAQDGIAGQVLELLPDGVGVTILTPADAPQVYTAIDLLRSAWWWLGLLALGTLAGALGVSRRGRRTLRAWAVTTTVLAVLVLAALRIARGLLLPQAQPQNRDAVGAIYDVLAGSLRAWTLWLLVLALVVVVLTLAWGRLGLVAGVRRGVATARVQLRTRREDARAARALEAGAGTEAGTAPVGDEPWTRRVALWFRGFADGLDLPARTASLGAAVRDHFVPARWAGIALGALVLLFWPAPTLSVLIWIVALVALYVGALDWLRNRAAEPATPQATAQAVVPGTRGVGNGPPLPPAVVPASRQGTADGAPAGAFNGTSVATVAEPGVVPAPAKEPLVPEQLTSQAISTLNDRLDLLVRLGAARDSGVLTDDEFLREKDRLLGV
jgi:hypothetical protein